MFGFCSYKQVPEWGERHVQERMAMALDEAGSAAVTNPSFHGTAGHGTALGIHRVPRRAAEDTSHPR